MAEKVTPVLTGRQRLVNAGGHECTGCGRVLAEGEQAIYTPPTWPPSYNAMAQLTCAACYVPPARPERFTDATVRSLGAF